jgi:ribosome-binding factor A
MARQKKAGGNPRHTYQERIKNEINMILRREVNDPRLTLCSVTRVELNPDYSTAEVYWDTFDSSKRGDIKSAIDGLSGKMRSLLAKNLDVRHTPTLTFLYDSQFEDEMKITELLKTNNSINSNESDS